MKVSVNLATFSSPGERYALAWAVPLALFGALGLVLLARAALSNFNEYHKVEQKLDAEVLQAKALNDREAAMRKSLDQPGQKAVFQEAHFVNELIDEKQFSVTGVIQRVSKLVPSSVRLISLSVSRPKTDILVRFSVIAHDEDGVEKFIENLEDATDFTDLNVTNQSQGAGKLEAGTVGIICTARYLGEEAK